MRILSGSEFLAEPLEAPWDFSGLARLHDAVDEKCRRQESLGGVVCREGCYHCCRRIPTILPVEFAFLHDAVKPEPSLLESLLHPGEPLCDHLAKDGSCRIYERRPLICRSHGYLHLSDEGLDCCPWNFPDLEEVAEDLPFRQQDLHETLLQVNLAFLRTSYPLEWRGLARVRIRFQ